MNEDKGETKIDLSKYRKHHKKFPWGLVRKIIIAIIMIALFYYLFDQIENKKEDNKVESQDSIPVEITN